MTPRSEQELQAATTRAQDISGRVGFVHGQFEASVSRRAVLHGEVSTAKGRQGLGEDMQRQFEALQQRAHERSVGAFERLLTAILGDVLPDEGLVKLELSMKNNSTWMDVLLEKDGLLEDALEGNGGAVANVLSTGLRFAALSRTKNRRALVLDEPDCWVKPARVRAFVNVIAQVSKSAKFQTFFISHHPPEYFEDAVNVIEVDCDARGKTIVKGTTHVEEDWADDEQPGIRAIELVNFRRHEHLVLRFRPGATAIVGENNLGKSHAILSSLKAVAYGESSDDVIRHHADEAVVTIYLERNRRIVWSRKLKRSPVVLYKLFEGDTLVCEGRPGKRNEAPEWVTAELGISRVDDLDVQLRNQKTPVFLLDDSASRRAQVLSIGRESGYLKMLLAEYESLKTVDRETVRQGEAEIARLDWRLKGRADAVNLPEDCKRAMDVLARVQAMSSSTFALGKALAALETATARCTSVREVATRVGVVPAKPVQVEPVALRASVAALERAARTRAVEASRDLRLPASNLLPADLRALLVQLERGQVFKAVQVPKDCAPPTVKAPREIATLGALIKRGAMLAALREPLSQEPKLPAARSPNVILEALSGLQRLADTLQVHQGERLKLGVEVESLGEEEEALKGEIGNQCPICGTGLPDKGFKHVH